MEFIAIGDLHLDGVINNYVPDGSLYIIEEVQRVVDWGLSKGISNYFLLGDVCHSPRMSYQSLLAFNKLINSNSEARFYIILGNHDQYGDSAEAGHSLEIFVEFGSRPNVRFITKPTNIKIEGAKVRFLPYPFIDTRSDALNIHHMSVSGSVGDNGRPNKSEVEDHHVSVAGHLHTKQKVRNTYYPGTLYQSNFGEGQSKFFLRGTYNSSKDYDFEFVPHKPKYKLHNIVITSKKDLKTIPQGPYDLVKLMVEEGANVDYTEWANMPNVVKFNPYKTQQDLRDALSEDMVDSEGFSINVGDFFQSWLEQSAYDDEYKKKLKLARKSIISLPVERRTNNAR